MLRLKAQKYTIALTFQKADYFLLADVGRRTKQNTTTNFGGVSTDGLISKREKYELNQAPTFLVLGTGYKMNSSVLHGTSLPGAYCVLYSNFFQHTRTPVLCT